MRMLRVTGDDRGFVCRRRGQRGRDAADGYSILAHVTRQGSRFATMAAMRLQTVLVLAFVAAQPPRYETRADHDPDGTGKFYRGREIARVMGHEAAGWLERPEREQEEKPSKLLE